MFESVRRGTLSELLADLPEKLKGEYVVVIQGKQ
jgi:16S rRNA C1402 (ribose-2'-O) methylase RsmI